MKLSEIRGAYYNERPRELRAVDVLNLRATVGLYPDADAFSVSGYASTTGTPYEVNDWLGSYDETIARGAFTKTLQERDDVRFLFNHDGMPLARSASGTLSLREIANPADDPQGKNQTGLWVQADLDSQSPLAQTLRSALMRGDVSQMSFAFQAMRQEWNEDYTQRTVNEVKLFDVSAVSYPANPLTSINMDSADMAGLMARVNSGKALGQRQRDMIADLVARVEAIESAREAELEPHVHDESDDEPGDKRGEDPFDITEDQARAITAALDEVVANRQNMLDALKRRRFN